MKSIVCTTPGRMECMDQLPPVMEKDHAIIRVKRIGVCGTDLHAFEGTQPFFNYPRVLGHEIAGELVEADNAPGFTKGELVSLIPYFSCGTCMACRHGKPNCCATLAVFGVHIDGGLKEYISVPSYALVHGNGLNIDELALVEPLAIGAHGIGRAGVSAGEFVLVVGAGPIGLAAMEFARIAGANVMALDINEDRLAFCRNQLAVPYVLNAGATDVQEHVKDITGGDMPAVVIDATGSLTAINHSFQYIAHGGRYVLIGLQKGDITFSHPEFHKREATLMSSRNALRQDFENVIGAVRNGTVKPGKYITHRLPFNSLPQQFETLLKQESEVIKAMIEIK